MPVDIPWNLGRVFPEALRGAAFSWFHRPTPVLVTAATVVVPPPPGLHHGGSVFVPHTATVVLKSAAAFPPPPPPPHIRPFISRSIQIIPLLTAANPQPSQTRGGTRLNVYLLWSLNKSLPHAVLFPLPLLIVPPAIL
jgi:hypothetical protein